MAKKVGKKKVAKKPVPVADRPVRTVLAIDGGGILGLTTAIYLRALQDEIGAPLHTRFDLIAGTSTGSILAVALGGGLSIDDMIALYKDRGPEIFGGGESWLDKIGRVARQGVSRPKYADEGLETCLREELAKNGRPLRGKDMKTRVLITAYDTIKRESWVFKSWRGYLEHLEWWRLVKGSCSAPTFFPAHADSFIVPRPQGGVQHRRFSLIDGGVWANNPSAVALAEALRINAELASSAKPTAGMDEIAIASFGNLENAALPITDDEAREWGGLEWVKDGDLINVMMDGAKETAMYVCRSMIGSERVVRLSPLIDDGEEHEMDDASERHLRELEDFAMTYVDQQDVRERLKEIAALV